MPPASTQRSAATFPTSTFPLAAGDLEPVPAWLGPRIHHRGRLVAPPVLIAEACGEAPTETALLDYLEAKFGEVYGL